MKMLVAIIFICGMLCALTPRAALAADDLGGGFVAGLNFSGVSFGGTSDLSTSSKPALVVGGFVTFPFSTLISVQPECLILQRRFESSVGTYFSTGPFNERLGAIEIPILVRLDVPTSGQRHFYALAGPGFSFLTSARETRISDGREEDIKKLLRGTDMILVVGAGIALGHLGVEARYTAGLRNIDPVPSRDDPSTKFRSFTVLLRYRAK